MVERPNEIPPAELEPVEGFVLSSERPDDYFTIGEPLVVYGRLGGEQKGLKRGMLDHFSEDGRCLFVDLEVKPTGLVKPQSIGMAMVNKHKGLYIAGRREPIVMKESEFESIRCNRERIGQWVRDIDDQRLKEALRRALTVGAIVETPASEDSPGFNARNLIR